MSSVAVETLVPCFCCGKQFESVDSANVDWHVQPHQGLIFLAAGNFGSRIFDSNFMGEPAHRLLVLICDDCVRDRLERVLLQKREQTKVIYSYSTVESTELLPGV